MADIAGQAELATRVSLEVNGRSWVAASPREVCRGECSGLIQYIPIHAGAKTLEGGILQGLDNQKRIFICDSASMMLRPLLPHALGFIFGEGAALGHFCRILRDHRIPAVIDAFLWKQAKAALHPAGSDPTAKFKCGQAMHFTEEILASHHLQVKEYQRRLQSRRLVTPLYDMASGVFRVNEPQIDPRIGEKALGVNALQAEGFPSAKALILTHPVRAKIRVDKDALFHSVIGRIFPPFDSLPGYALIVRGSLHSDVFSNFGMPGLLTSPTVTSLKSLASAIDEHVSRWESIGSQNRFDLSIIVQERIASPIFGILGTACPWDYSQEGTVAELTFDFGNGVPKTHILLDKVDSMFQNSSLAEIVKPSAGCGTITDQKGFCDAFARLVRDGLLLQDRYSLPLDIEFVLTRSLQHVFVQFRPLFHLDPP